MRNQQKDEKRSAFVDTKRMKGENMRKKIRVLCMVAFAMLFVVLGSVQTQAADVTLKNGKWAKGTFKGDKRTEKYYKIKVNKTGYIRIDYQKAGSAEEELTICNAKKKKLGEIALFSEVGKNCEAYYALKKGTYYLHLSGFAISWDEEDEEDYDDDYDETTVKPVNYKIKYTFTAMKDKKLPTSQKKAETLKSGKEVSGLLLGKKNKNIFYKITVSKKTKVKLNYELMVSGEYFFMFIRDQKLNALYVDSKGNVKKKKDSFSWWEGKGSETLILPKGTYYFTIQPDEKDGGYYKLKLTY